MFGDRCNLLLRSALRFELSREGTTVRIFSCPVCGSRLHFENGACVACGSQVAFEASTLSMRATRDGGRLCRNATECGCNWLAETGAQFCLSCGLNETIPPIADPLQRQRWASVESAKRRLVYDLLRLHLAPLPIASPDRPLCFRILVDAAHGGEGTVTMGHEDGMITIDASEADSFRREGRRERLGEAFRTMLGHLRHETGHYIWDCLEPLPGFRDAFRNLFGDERADYSAAMSRHYAEGAPANWQQGHISAYATMHPWEDWAETFAHYLHMVDGLETFGDGTVRNDLRGARPPNDPDTIPTLDAQIDRWIDVSLFMNEMNRGIGHRDFYPFVVPSPVRLKLHFVHEWLRDFAAGDVRPVQRLA
jgi:hypothetical protein